MKALYLVSIGMFLFHSAFAQTQNVPDVFKNTLAMTVSTALLRPSVDETSEGQLTILPDRANTLLVEHGAQVRFKYQIQPKKKAPLIFVIPGTGGQFSSGTSLFIAEKLYALGYSIVTVDNPFHWRFAVSASRRGLPGNPAVDAVDLYQVLGKIKNFLRLQEGVRPSSYSLVGYSLGGLHSLFLKKIDEEARQFGFAKILAINPPVDFFHAVDQLDLLSFRARHISEGDKAYITGRLVNIGGKLLNSSTAGTEKPSFQEIFNKFGFSNSDLNYLVADSFSSSLRDVIFASQQVRDLGILKAPASRYRQSARLDEVSQFTFRAYLEKFVFPQEQKLKGDSYGLDDLNSEISFYQFADLVKSNDQIYLVHAQDDFLLKAGDIPWLQDLFGSRALIFPFGGHCGDIGFPQFTQYLQSIFTMAPKSKPLQ